MRIHITVGGERRPKPQVGDRKMIRGVEHVRIFERVKTGPYKGSYVVGSSGRNLFEWVPLAQAPAHLRDKTGRRIGKGFAAEAV
ncbi:hypothetical protein [Cupriavidus sp. DL-D2]|uniref:hypothetical protein n=1 Tax=Cupriavidus sp. DL-D2 TaxID=3144974 RepID=UPI0032131555